MPIHRGPRLDDQIVRLVGRAIPLQANIIQTWPDLANDIALPTGVWTQIIAAASAPAVPFTMMLNPHTSGVPSQDSGSVELGVGAAASEVAVAAAGIMAGGQPALSEFFPFPIIPAGSRVSLRPASGFTAGGALITSILPPRSGPETALRMARKEAWTARSYPGLPSFMNFGYNTAYASCSGSAWTYGAWKERAASTAITDTALMFGFTAIWQISQAQSVAYQCEVQWGYGGTDGDGNAPTATFVSLIMSYTQGSAANHDGNAMPQYFRFPYPIIIPNATRLAYRVATDTATGAVPIMTASPFGMKGLIYP